MMKVAKLTAQRSKCRRAKFGCVLSTPDFSSFWTGYNGGPKGGINTCRREEPGNCGCTHGEMNAVAKAERGDKIAFLYPFWACERCAVMLVNAGVTEVWYGPDVYRDINGLLVFEEVGIPHHHWSNL